VTDKAALEAEVATGIFNLLQASILDTEHADAVAREVIVNRALEAQPETDAQLFDMLHSLFGIGNFDDSGVEQWWQFRIREIAKLKAIRKRRGISLADLAVTARYCHRHHEQVRESWQVCGFITDAKREARRLAVPALSQEVRDALELERALPGPDSAAWVERLLMTRGPFRRDVVDLWKQSRENKP
jgi:hypothetical protein